jgi:hypothetical protein
MINDFINKFKNLPDDHIGDELYIAFEWVIRENEERKLCRIYIGSKTNGPMLQYNADGIDMYTGRMHVRYKNGCWTNCYSRGNFGKKYAFGGNWSGHTKNLHQKLKLSPIINEETPVIINGEKAGTVTDMDCSGSWSIWYTTAKAALIARLKKEEIAESSLPDITKQHLLKNETHKVLDCLNDVIEAYEL